MRTALRLRLAGEGASWLLLLAVVGVFASVLFDYWFHLNVGLRIFVLAVALAGAVLVVVFRLIIPLAAPMGEDDLVMLVERRWRLLEDRLISALQFSRPGRIPPGASRAMILRMADQANDMTGRLSFGSLVNYRGLIAAAAFALSGVVLLTAFSCWQQTVMGIWMRRNVLFQEVPWPQDTYLRVGGGPDFSVLRGENLTVKVFLEERSRETPDDVVFHAKYPSVGMTEEQVRLDVEEHAYVKTFSNVNEEFTFHVTGGDDRRDRKHPHRVRLIEPPDLVELDYSISYPAYMNRLASAFQPIKGVLTAPLGATLTIRGRANKPLRSAEALLGDRVVGATKVLSQGEPAESGREVLSRFVLHGRNETATAYVSFRLVDIDGYKSRQGQRYMIQTQPDQEPVVELSSRGVAGSIAPNALIPLRMRIRDDDGVAAVSAGVDLPERKPPATQPAGPQAFEVKPSPGGRKEYSTTHELDLAELEVGPMIGEVITAYVEAKDTMSLDVHPTVGAQIMHLGPNAKRASLEFKVVSPDEIRADLVRRQKDISNEFSQAQVDQRGAWSKTGAVADAASGSVPANARLHLRQSARVQSAVGNEVSKATALLGDIRDEMHYNRVFPKDVVDSLSEIVERLRTLGGSVAEAQTLLAKSIGVLDANEPDVAALAASAEAAAAKQKEIADEMDRIAKLMIKIEGRQDIINQVLIIKRLWEQGVIGPTEKLREEQIREMLGTTRPSASRPAAP